jgi:SpoVK/Ycf46/Vps4 family AAA+-type ATPase
MSNPTKRKNNNINSPSSKKSNKQLFIYSEDLNIKRSEDYTDEDEININTLFEEKVKEHVIIKKQINCLQDLIDLGLSYDYNKTYNINLEILFGLVGPLTELNNMIGMESVKQDIMDHIIFKIQNLSNLNDMMHTVIQGPPGIGKTQLAKIIGKIYLGMGILRNNKFVKASRSHLIGEYLGQTARTTQRVIDSAFGGVLFIDEVYSLGNSEKRDSFSKECIDTINENLTEKKNDFICIIAGYKNEINSCFFSYNPGLERRFPVRFTIEPYTPEEIYKIFKKQVSDDEWSLCNTVTSDFFKKNIKEFKYFGGDMEVLFARCKRAHSRRLISTSDTNKKILTIDDLNKGFEIFSNHKNVEKKPSYLETLYV